MIIFSFYLLPEETDNSYSLYVLRVIFQLTFFKIYEQKCITRYLKACPNLMANLQTDANDLVRPALRKQDILEANLFCSIFVFSPNRI